MKYFTIIATLFAATFVAAAPAPAPVPAPMPADGDSVTPASLGYKRDEDDLGYKREAAPAVAIAAKDKRHCAAPLKN